MVTGAAPDPESMVLFVVVSIMGVSDIALLLYSNYKRESKHSLF